LHQFGDLFELNVKLRWQKVKEHDCPELYLSIWFVPRSKHTSSPL